MASTVTHDLPMLLDEVEVARVDRLSPSFVRIELGGACLAEFGVDGPLYDQRIKLVFPGVPGGPPPSFEGADASWFDTWLSRPEQERGHMRTYTVRDVRGEGVDTRLVVDIVLHDDADGHEVGPGCAWAERAAVGDRVVLLAPRRGQFYGGIEFDPGTAGRLLLAGDETAVPAICAILAQLPWDATGAAYLEVPTAADVQTVQHPEGVQIVWLARDGEPLGDRLHAAVTEHLGLGPVSLEVPDEVDPDLWETPSYSSSGEDVANPTTGPTTSPTTGTAVAPAVRDDLGDLYAWIAGESSVVTAMRRLLVRDLGVDRRQVAFMGYWRRGVAMRS